MWVVKILFAALVAVAATSEASKANGQAPNGLIVVSEAQRVALGLDAQYQAALIRERRLADDRELRLMAEAELKLAKLRVDYDLKVAGAEADLQVARTAYSQLVESISAKNVTFRQEIEAYRSEIRGMTANATPERLDALQRFADGDRINSWPVLDALRLSEDRALQIASNVRRAVRWRSDADLRQIMRANGEATVDQVLALREFASELDATHYWNEIERGRLLELKGRLLDAWRAADRAYSLAADDDERIIALVDMGDAEWSGGFWDAARSTYARAAGVSREGHVKNARNSYIAVSRFTSRLYDDDQNTVFLLKEYLRRVGEQGLAPEKATALASVLPVLPTPNADYVSLAETVLVGQIKLWEEASAKPEAGDAANWSVVNSELSIAYGQLAFMRFMQSRWEEAAELHTRELEIDRERVKREPTIANQQHLARSLQDVADVELLRGNYGLAAVGYKESMAITFSHFERDPNNGDYVMPYLTSTFRAGALFLIARDFPRAKDTWKMTKLLIDELAKRSPEARSDDFQLMAVNLLLELLGEASGGG